MDLGLVSTVADSKETSSVPFSGKWAGKNQTWILQTCNCSSDKERNKQNILFTWLQVNSSNCEPIHHLGMSSKWLCCYAEFPPQFKKKSFGYFMCRRKHKMWIKSEILHLEECSQGCEVIINTTGWPAKWHHCNLFRTPKRWRNSRWASTDLRDEGQHLHFILNQKKSTPMQRARTCL